MREQLTEPQETMLKEIKIWIKKNNYPPTIRDLMKRLDKKSPGGVHKMLKYIESKGYIKTKTNKSRTITTLE